MENSIFTNLSMPEVKQLIREALKDYFSSNPISIETKDSEPKIVDLPGLIKARPIVGTMSTIYKKVASGQIPHSKRGKKLYFNLEEIDKWLLANKVQTIDEMEAGFLNGLKNR
ncbi:MAG: helix-turn-helix domain-containing protein [Saprospiraceae bacterium]|nr:helix-turn-helix domain-containing protein [Saprospiraceae bacterium]